MKEHTPHKKLHILKAFGRFFVILFWAVLILFCMANREQITVQGIVDLIPKNSGVSILVMLCLYALKSVAVFVYGGILYAASGILFSLPVAILVNTVGTAIMISIPFWIGKRAGEKSLGALIQKNKKIALLRELQNTNEFFSSFFIRIVGLLPADLVAMYLGASGMRYRSYFWGSMLGLFPSIVCFSVMGMSIDDVGSPQFIISTVIQVALMVVSVILYWLLHKKHKSKKETEEKL